MKLEQFWPRCLHHLHNTLPAKQYQSWIAPLSVGEGARGEWVVYAPSVFVLNMLRTRYAAEIRRLASEWLPDSTPELLLQKGRGVRYDMAADPGGTEEQPAAHPASATEPETETAAPRASAQPKQRSAQDIVAARMQQLGRNGADPQAEGIGKPAPAAPSGKAGQNSAAPVPPKTLGQLSPEYTFDTLVEGKGNSLAAAVGRSIAEKPGHRDYNPFFLYGSTGLGKTHLAQAIGNELLRLHPKAKVCYLHAGDYVNEIMKAAREKTFEQFKRRYRDYDLVIIDDIQLIKSKDRTMEEFFYLYNHLHQHKKQIILTCDVLPVDIEELDDRLKSRFSWGLTLQLEPPELEMRVQILQKKAATLGVDLDEEAAFFIAQHIRSNVRELEGAFNRVQARSRFTGKPISKEMAADTLKDLMASSHKPITVELIVAAVAKYYGIKESELTGKRRTQNVIRPRQLAMSLAKDLTSLSLSAIGESIGKRDHSTVINALEQAAKLRREYPEFDKDYEKLLILIKN